MPGARSYVSGNFAFQLEGVKCGFIKRVEGGDITADVVEEPVKLGYFAKKHISQPKYEDIELSVDFGMAPDIYDWIRATLGKSYIRKNGSITVVDYNLQATSERQFFNALITEIGFPALDAASKEPAYLTVKFSPEYTRIGKASGKVAAVKPAARKQFLPSNFRLELDGLDCTKVSKIDSFTVKQTPQKDDIGDLRDMQKEPGRVEFPNLRVELAEATAATWHEWHEDFVVKGNNDDAHEKSGTIVFLTPNRQEELARIDLFNVGIFALRRRPATAATEKVSRVVAELYCERMELQVGKPLPR